MPYIEEINYLYSLQQFGIKLGLSNIREICSLLDNPQDKIKTIHVGGTNGKGSTAAILSAILHSAGYRVGLYTSPHLSDFTERIRIDNTAITHEMTSRLISCIRRYIKDRDIHPTFFEFATAIALLHFAEEGVDIAVIEVGMGGRLDATNLINPLVSIITNVEYDHTEHLGPTLENIAKEKCGIIKKDVPVVTSEQKVDILSIIEDSARMGGTMAYAYGRDFYAEPVKLSQWYSEFYYNGLSWRGLLLNSPLTGRHQMFNMGIALYTTELLREMGFDAKEEQVKTGILNVSWPGRLETVSGNPQVLLDGAHNHAGVRALREFIERVLLRERNCGKIVLIFGVLKDKDARSMIGELLPFSLIPFFSGVIITRPDVDRGLPVESLREIVEGYGIKPHVTGTVSEALSLAYDITSSSDIIVVTGSLYIVGEARGLLLNNRVCG